MNCSSLSWHPPSHCCLLILRAQHKSLDSCLPWYHPSVFPLTAPCLFPSRPLIQLVTAHVFSCLLNVSLTLLSCPEKGIESISFTKVRSYDMNTAGRWEQKFREGAWGHLLNSFCILSTTVLSVPGTVWPLTIYLLNK